MGIVGWRRSAAAVGDLTVRILIAEILIAEILIVGILIFFGSSSSFAATDSVGEKSGDQLTALEMQALEKESYDQILKRHRTVGLITAPLVGLQIGLGVGLLRNERDPPDHSLRALHTLNSLALIGMALSQFYDGRAMAGDQHFKISHAHWAYGYLGLIAASGVLGIIQGHFIDRSTRSYDVMASVHTGVAVSAGALVTLTLLHAPL